MAQQGNNSCNMVGLLGILIQIGLGVLSFSVLLIKRYRENPPRPWKIWIFDTSKQLVSQMLAHFMNLTISIALTYEDSTSDECLWYFTTNILDNTIGVLICVFCLVSIQKTLVNKGRSQYVSGNYYTTQQVFVTIEVMNKPLDDHKSQQPNKQEEQKDKKEYVHDSLEGHQDSHNVELVEEKDEVEKETETGAHLQCQSSSHTEMVEKIHIDYKAWLVQLLIWIAIVVTGKSILFAFQFALQGPLKNLTFSTMGWIEKYEVLQLVVVIVIIPVIMNGLAFWVQDNFLKKQEGTQSESQTGQQHPSHKQQQKYEIM